MEKKLTDTINQSDASQVSNFFAYEVSKSIPSRKRDRDQINCYNMTIAILLETFEMNRLLYYSVLSLFKFDDSNQEFERRQYSH